MIDLQSTFEIEFNVTSSHKVRKKNDMQLGFAYFHWLMQAYLARSVIDIDFLAQDRYQDWWKMKKAVVLYWFSTSEATLGDVISEFLPWWKLYKYELGSMNKVGYISYHNDGNTLQLDNVLNSKEILPFAQIRYLSVLRRFRHPYSVLCCHAELKD